MTTDRDDQPGNPFSAEEFDKAQVRWVRVQAAKRSAALTASGAVGRHPSAQPDREANLERVRGLRETLRRTAPAQPPPKVRDDKKRTG